MKLRDPEVKNEFFDKQKKATTKCYFRVAHNLCFDNGRFKPFAMKLIGQRFCTYQPRFKSEGRRTGIFCAIHGQ